MPHTTTCRCSAQGKSTIPGCSLPQMPPHQRKFLDSLPVGYLVLARLEDRITEGLPENEYCLTEAEWTSLIAYTTMPAPDDLNGAALNAKLRSCRTNTALPRHPDGRARQAARCGDMGDSPHQTAGLCPGSVPERLGSDPRGIHLRIRIEL